MEIEDVPRRPTRRCLCSNPATVFKDNDYLCARCAGIEADRFQYERRREARRKMFPDGEAIDYFTIHMPRGMGEAE